jgi:hypothetical protein
LALSHTAISTFSPSAHSFLKDCALEIFQYFLFFLPFMLPTAYYKGILLIFRSVSASLDGSIYPALVVVDTSSNTILRQLFWLFSPTLSSFLFNIFNRGEGRNWPLFPP